MNYFYHIVILAGIFSILGVSLSFLANRLGLVSLAQVLFFSIGAYSAALISTANDHNSFLYGVLVGLALSVIFSVIIFIFSLSLKGDTFVLATICLQLLTYEVLLNTHSLTNGPMGITGIPEISIFGFSVDTNLEVAFLVYSVVLVVFYLLNIIRKSSYGTLLSCIREDEAWVRSLGKNINLAKFAAVALCSMIASLSGALYAHYVGFIDPTSFTISTSILILMIAVIGGTSSSFGALVGSFLVIAIPEALRYLDISPATSSHIRHLLFGVILIYIVIYSPTGLISPLLSRLKRR